jgi:hypothetical protein
MARADHIDAPRSNPGNATASPQTDGRPAASICDRVNAAGPAIN